MRNSWKSEMSWYKMFVIKVEVHTERTDAIRLWHVWMKAILQKMAPHCHAWYVLVTWQRSVLKSETIRWVNNGCNLNKQWGDRKPKMAAWFFTLSGKFHDLVFVCLHPP